MSDPSVAEPTPDPTPSPTPDPAPEPAPTPDPSPDPAPSGGDNVVWPEDWREKLSGDDKKVAEELGRYAEPGLIGPALVEAKNKIRSADIRTPFPDEASDEDKAKWRKDNGVPKDAAGYFDKLPEGIDIKEEDKAGMETLASAMHAVHAPPEVMNAAMGAYYTHIENAEAQLSEMDKDSKKAADDALHELYGGEFRRNINDFGAWLGTAGKEVKDKILSARMMPSGTPLGNDPEVVKWLIGQMREINPVITVPGLGAGEPGLALTDEIAKIEKTILTDNRAYRGDPKMQARYLELIAARDSHKGPDARK